MVSPPSAPEIIDVFLHGRRQIRTRHQGFEEWPEAGHELLARRQVFSHPIHERGQSFRPRQ